MAGRVVYDEPTPQGSLAAIVYSQPDVATVVKLSRLFEDDGHTDEVSIRVHELRAILDAIDGSS